MRTTTRNLFVAAMIASAVAVTATAQRVLADITGKWTMTIAGPNGANESAVVFKQEADALSGTIENQLLGAAKLAGTVKGDTVKFAFTVDMQGNVFELKAGGMIKDKDNIAGQLEAPNGMGTFPFTIKRVP
ncbi:MAG: hypothetical protein H7Z40_22905 [Phycisphaerae bacterium]|nr:hypothetical protein [Gemmatimonadaceae bacterium]